jgi:hypothetical protein
VGGPSRRAIPSDRAGQKEVVTKPGRQGSNCWTDEARARELEKILEHHIQVKAKAYCFGQRGRDGFIDAQIMKFVVADKAGRPLFEM